ncbi:hypothetical protein FACS1894190_05580 [Spirochaetia bacterium]|nr:hypothetical protein FACS1894190_05580 [Spirochaetia bacterium]
MKKSKLFLFGMIAALVAGSLFMTGCEGPAGPAGAAGANGTSASALQAAELAAFGYTFSDPIHVSVGRDAVLSPAIVGATPLATAAAGDILSGAPLNNELVTVTFNKRSVTFNPGKTTTYTPAALLAEFNGALGPSGGNLGLTADFVTVGGSYYFRIKADGALPSGYYEGNTYPLAGIRIETTGNTNSVLTRLFGAAPTVSLLENPVIAEAKQDEWIYPIVQNDLSSGVITVNSIITVGNVKLPVAAGAIPAAVINDLVAEISEQETKVNPVYAYNDYKVSNGSGSNINGIKFTAAVVASPVPILTPAPGVRAFDTVARRPSISTSVLDPYLDTYGYTLIVKQMAVGAAAIPTVTPSASSTPVATSPTNISATSAPIAKGDRLTISYDGLTDVIVFPSAAANAINDQPKLQAITGTGGALTGVIITVSAGNNVTFTAPGTPAVKSFNVTGEGGIVATGGIFASATVTQGTLGLVGNPGKNEVADSWNIKVIGANPGFFPTVASKITLSPGTGIEKLIPAKQTNADAIAALLGGLTVTGYSATSYVSGNSINVTKATGETGNTTITAAIGGL